MNAQILLFTNETGRARRTDPDTAKQAAKTVKVGALEAVVLAHLRAAGSRGMTTEELVSITGESLVSISPRLRPLVDKGYVLDSGVRRQNTSGRKAIVWVLA